MTVETAAGGTEAVEKLNDESFDLVLLDVMLPDIDGFSIVQRVRERFVFPIILLTAKVGEFFVLKYNNE